MGTESVRGTETKAKADQQQSNSNKAPPVDPFRQTTEDEAEAEAEADTTFAMQQNKPIAPSSQQKFRSKQRNKSRLSIPSIHRSSTSTPTSSPSIRKPTQGHIQGSAFTAEEVPKSDSYWNDSDVDAGDRDRQRDEDTNIDDNDNDNASVIHYNSCLQHQHQRRGGGNHHNYHDDTFTRTVSRISVRTKQVVWDSNELSIEAAVSAVDHWEAAYQTARKLVQAGCASAVQIYLTAKDGASKLEHGLLLPLRDWVLLPAFFGAERLCGGTIHFLQSPSARHAAEQTLQLARQVPLVGTTLLAPTLYFSTVAVQRTWHIVQYPIPSKSQVRTTVDWSLNATKWALAAAAREISLYVRRADANITRTLSHTQWKVLGSGPYTTLDEASRNFVQRHFCERYFAVKQATARYELIAHCQRHNPALCNDLLAKGVLRQHRTDNPLSTEIEDDDDEWLSPTPVYRDAAFWQVVAEKEQSELTVPFLLDQIHITRERKDPQRQKEYALWFRWPKVNGKSPAKDAPWMCFPSHEQFILEERYQRIVREEWIVDESNYYPVIDVEEENVDISKGDHPIVDEHLKEHNSTKEHKQASLSPPPPPTIAQWYTPTPTDILIDQQRHAVSFYALCPDCRQKQKQPQSAYGKVCTLCLDRANNTTCIDEAGRISTAVTAAVVQRVPQFAPPPLDMIFRPTFWRFYGPGDEVRRATWVLDTARHGLQPFDVEAQAVLEDAYLFLKWMAYRKSNDPDRITKVQNSDGESALDGTLLTVEVQCPDGTERLVHFSSLTKATAIQKGLGAAMAVFKRRVYRGAWLENLKDPPKVQRKHSRSEMPLVKPAVVTPLSLNDAIARAVEEHGTIGDTMVPNVSLRSILEPPISPQSSVADLLPFGEDRLDALEASLGVPPDRLANQDMARYMCDARDSKIDHLCLIVHGIGEMLRSIDVFGMSLQNLSEVCDSMRTNHASVQDAHFAQMYPTADADCRALTGRVEYLPVEWHESFSILTQRRAPLDVATNTHEKISNYKTQTEITSNTSNITMIQDISLRTIPNMRDFANDTLMDVLFFMSQEHHDRILDIVTHEMNFVVKKFRAVTGFNGSISIVGHSLGSVIAWDILQNAATPFTPQLGSDSSRTGSMVSSGGSHSEQSDTPELTTPKSAMHNPAQLLPLENMESKRSPYPQLCFAVDNFFMLGSPVPVFLLIRKQLQPLSEEFYLRGCRRVFNIFHPYDPVAYRIEPCISSRNSNYEPSIVKHWNGGFRVHYRTRRLWRKFVETTAMTQKNVVEAFEQSMAGMGLLDAANDTESDNEDEDCNSEMSESRSNNYVITGQLNQGRRIDYMLQEKEIENANEYVAALAAHSSYWIEKDISLFIARQIYLSTLEASATEASDQIHWEALTPEDLTMYSQSR